MKLELKASPSSHTYCAIRYTVLLHIIVWSVICANSLLKYTEMSNMGRDTLSHIEYCGFHTMVTYHKKSCLKRHANLSFYPVSPWQLQINLLDTCWPIRNKYFPLLWYCVVYMSVFLSDRFYAYHCWQGLMTGKRRHKYVISGHFGALCRGPFNVFFITQCIFPI